MERVSSESGFSLIELLVSFCIVGILASSAVTSTGVYREKAEQAAAQTYFRNLKTAFAGRIEMPSAVTAGNYRRAYQYFNSDIWYRTQVAKTDDFIPGYPNVPANYYVYVIEYNCTGNVGWCLTEYLFMADCKSGEVRYSLSYSNGYQDDYNYYEPYYDGLC